MGGYVVRRVLLAVPTLLGLSFLIFVLGSVAGDPSGRLAERGLLPGEVPTAEQIAAVHHQLGLDQPIVPRFGRWLEHGLRGDLGRSVLTGEGVGHAIRGAFPATAALALATIALIVTLAVPMGVAGAVLRGRRGEHVLRLMALSGASIPGFFLSYLLVYLFAVRLHLLPVAGQAGLRSLVLPAVALSVGPAALVGRLLQATMTDVLGEDYIRAARAKGLSALPVLFNHALKNAAIPVLTVLGGVFGRLIEGAVVIELIFARSGIGHLTLDAIGNADYPMLQGVVMFAGVVFVTLNLVVDLSYSRVDPRVRLGAVS